MGALTNRRPFRSPHHSASMPALVGGGLGARPARCRWRIAACCSSMSCRNFSRKRSTRCANRWRPAEVAIARANHRITYPARFMLVAAMNPCRCGRASDPGFTCRRGRTRAAPPSINKLSGPLLDRIDLNIEVPAVAASDLILPPPAEGSGGRARVARARDDPGGALLSPRSVRHRHQCGGAGCGPRRRRPPRQSGLALLREAADAMRLSARYHRVLRVARTARRSRRRRQGRPRPSRRGVILPRTDGRNQTRGVMIPH